MPLSAQAAPISAPRDPGSPQLLIVAREIEQLACSRIQPPEFFRRFLEKLVSAVGASAGAVWLKDRGQLHLCCDENLNSTGVLASTVTQQWQLQTLNDVAGNGQSTTVHTDDTCGLELPCRHLLLLTALHAKGVFQGVVELFLRPDIPPAARAGYLLIVEQLTAYASLFLERGMSQQVEAATVIGEFDNESGWFGLQVQHSLFLNEVAAVIANEGRLLVGCDRVSVLLRRGTLIHACAISGQETINARSNLVTSMIRLSRESIQSGVTVKYSGSTDSFSPQLKDRLADFAHYSGARMVYVIPLRSPTPLLTSDSPPSLKTTKVPDRIIGCVVLEQFRSSEPSPLMDARLGWLTMFSAVALQNAQTRQSMFLLPLGRFLGEMANWMHGRRLLKTLGALALIFVVAGVLSFVRTDFRIEGSGRLMPVVRHEIFAPSDGEVVDVLVVSGEEVAAGQLLVKLRNNELHSERIAAESQLDEKHTLLAALLAERDAVTQGPSGERGHRIEGELAKTRAEVRGLARRLQTLDDREHQLDITSPSAGIVSTFEVEQLLKHRPVRRGEILLEVMDTAGAWQLELQVDEDRMGHLFRAQQATTNPLSIEYLLVSSPERTHVATVKTVGSRVVTSQDNQPVIEVFASPSPDSELPRRIGSEVRARIRCGRKSVGYVVFGDIIEFTQKYLWL